MAVKTITVVGGGIMGSGIAHVAAIAGFDTTLVDVNDALLSKSRGQIATRLEREGQGGALKNLRTSTDLAAATRSSDLVVEAVPEKIDLKIQVFATCDRECPSHTVLATNTSGLSITEIAAATGRPKKVVGMHFFNPVHKMRLIEIVRGTETDEETLGVAADVSRAMGKETVLIKESPGFVTSRVNALIGNEAFYMLQDGIASARDIDKALKLGLNHPMGPFELVDLVGLDTRLSILRYLHEKLGEKYRPCPLIEQYVGEGRLGRKTGRGVYDYPSPNKT